MTNELDHNGRANLYRNVELVEDSGVSFREQLVRNYGNVDVSLVVGADGEELDFVVYGAFLVRSEAESYARAHNGAKKDTRYHVETGSVRTLEGANKITFKNVDGTERGEFTETDRQTAYRALKKSLLGEFA